MLTDDDKQWIKSELERVENSLLTALREWQPLETRDRDAESADRNKRIKELLAISLGR